MNFDEQKMTITNHWTMSDAPMTFDTRQQAKIHAAKMAGWNKIEIIERAPVFDGDTTDYVILVNGDSHNPKTLRASGLIE